jgi:hypothetical protein
LAWDSPAKASFKDCSVLDIISFLLSLLVAKKRIQSRGRRESTPSILIILSTFFEMIQKF